MNPLLNTHLFRRFNLPVHVPPAPGIDAATPVLTAFVIIAHPLLHHGCQASPLCSPGPILLPVGQREGSATFAVQTSKDPTGATTMLLPSLLSRQWQWQHISSRAIAAYMIRPSSNAVRAPIHRIGMLIFGSPGDAGGPIGVIYDAQPPCKRYSRPFFSPRHLFSTTPF